VRAKVKIRDERIPYQVPSQSELPDRLDSMLRVIYLVFNKGYSASAGGSLTRPDLSGEAIRLERLLVALLPKSEAMCLLALMLLHERARPTAGRALTLQHARNAGAGGSRSYNPGSTTRGTACLTSMCVQGGLKAVIYAQARRVLETTLFS
jgi:hypothetical protein